MRPALLLVFVPISLALEYVLHAPAIWVFVTAIVAIIPLAELIRRATEQLALTIGSAIGGLLNVTFGNAAELILAIFVLLAGKTDVVKGQITGSLIGNSLVGLGLAIMVGTWGREKLTFARERAGLLSSLLVLSTIALLLPALFDYTEQRGGVANAAELDEWLSLGVAVVLVLVYVANLVYTLFTHRDVFAANESHGTAEWPVWLGLATLVGATVVTAFEAELVSGALEATATSLGITTFFLGVTVLAIVGNAAEYVSAVYFARQGQMGLVMTTTVGSTIQVALLVAPVLVLVSYALGVPMNLVFSNPLELIAIAGIAFVVSSISQDGEVTWFEGLLLLAVYALLALAFFFVAP
jgi:Ca2+:H+ antiporter